MSKIHEVKCDFCKRKVKLSYNGEHYLPPIGWVEFYDENEGEHTDEHLCNKCRPKFRAEEVAEAKP